MGGFPYVQIASVTQLAEQTPIIEIQAVGLWVTDRVYSKAYSIPRATLTTWRYQDHRAGRSEAASGYPVYRRWGRAVRYWLAPGSYDASQVSAIILEQPKRKAKEKEKEKVAA